MTASAISRLRLHNQQVYAGQFFSVQELVYWMGAIQAQDYGMAKYAIGLRLKDGTDKMVEDAINKARIIRTHVLRPTWHFVAAGDVRWMLELTATNLNRALSSNNKRLGLDEKTFKKANHIIEKLLSDGKHRTRKEIMAVLEQKAIKTNDLRAGHILFRAETDQVVCNGIKREKQFTYALMDERVPPSKKFTKEEALAELALRYFSSHGPASLQDFTWWSGLSITDARKGLEAVKSKMTAEKYKNELFWFSGEQRPSIKRHAQTVFLPAFDEFLISYKSRTISLHLQNAPRAFTSNGIFNPVIVENAKVIGTWKPRYKKEIFISAHFFDKPTEKQEQLCLKASQAFGRFMQKDIQLTSV